MLPESIFRKFGLVHTGQHEKPLRSTKLAQRNRQVYFTPFASGGHHFIKVFRDDCKFSFEVELEFLQDNPVELFKTLVLDTLK
jgi:hypothetical protein